MRRLHRRYGKEIERLKVKTFIRRDKAEEWMNQFRSKRSVVSGMVRDLEFCIEWMQTARMPGNRRGVERRSYKQREIATDPVWVRKLVQAKQGFSQLSGREIQLLDDLLGYLSKEQYECFVSIRGSGYTFSEVSSMLGMNVKSVEYHLCEAEKRLRQKVSGGEMLELQGVLF